MLFSGEEVLKKVNVFFGGEKVCCMFFKMMLSGLNVFLLDDFMNYFDLELIIVLNNGFISYKGLMIFIFYDY